MAKATRDPKMLRRLEKKTLWLACWMIDQANRREKVDGVKVGGHQASSASMVSLMTALYFDVLRPQDRVAVKPHASPVFHAIQYLMGNQTLEKLENFRGYHGAQSYPSRTKDVDDVDFSTGSVGLGVGITPFASLIQDYIAAKGWSATGDKPGRMIALVGDAELDEGNVYEALQEGWKHDLRNCWWIIDYNRQSLDGVVREGLYDRIEMVFKAFGWNVITLKYGALQRAAFEEPGGEALKEWIDACPNQLYSALLFQGGAAWRKRLFDDLADQGKVSALIERRSDNELSELMNNLGGHCLETLTETFNGIDHDRPTAFIAYTVKGYGTPLAGHKDNHSGLMTSAQMQAFQEQMKVRSAREWERFEGLDGSAEEIQAFLGSVPFFAKGRRRYRAERVDIPQAVAISPAAVRDEISTQAAFGRILDAIGKSDSDLAARIVTTSPDVTVSTNLGPWVNRRRLFARQEFTDIFRDQRIPSAQKWDFSPKGQHIELGIAEMNLFLLLGAAGLSHSLFGERLLPIGTLYDPFVSRGLDALNYGCYQDARFIVVGTPSGVSLSSEGGAHQSIAQPLIGMSQDGLASFEPAFADELAIIMAWAFDYLQREGEGDPDERTWLRDETGGSVYLRLSTRQIEQPGRKPNTCFAQEVIDGATWLKEPGSNADLIIAYQGTIGTEAIAAAGMLADRRRDIGVLSITSADRLNAGWQAAQRERARGNLDALSHVERLLGKLPRHCRIVTVIDGHPATLSWLGGVMGHKTISLGVEHFGQTGSVSDLYRHYGIDAVSIADTASSLTNGKS
ncbi:1-deoxy-D-xylulose-5-phosphate synthase N-terminal domain-containing protein [Mesorhizobium sp. NZP2077]|uniref:transketolase-like TK C-terminal-containing protein n=1 Tax=Mesorhizobium sp. NZP2077 TaxID=2483404 RepID=UPI001552D401|nr:1-deoxy-D-xylulose-5-phosphate synthase N-terminal domain-containing protein [Mesorhizobium sp. NZP2077]QKC86812.1 transketolase [Mesorhizobium sp. NZP2077]QKD20514.1 transketolase [Mesorhizobium sp. NZP2077]